MAAVNSCHSSVCAYVLTPLRGRVHFSLPVKSNSELVTCVINRRGQNGHLELLRTGHKKPCSFHWSPLNTHSWDPHTGRSQPPIMKSNNHETVILCEVQATWEGPGGWDSTWRERERLRPTHE